LKSEFLKNLPFKILKNHQNCLLSWSHIWKVLFWDLNVENLVYLTWNDPEGNVFTVLSASVNGQILYWTDFPLGTGTKTQAKP
jgi:hypothetical protein